MQSLSLETLSSWLQILSEASLATVALHTYLWAVGLRGIAGRKVILFSHTTHLFTSCAASQAAPLVTVLHCLLSLQRLD